MKCSNADVFCRVSEFQETFALVRIIPSLKPLFSFRSAIQSYNAVAAVRIRMPRRSNSRLQFSTKEIFDSKSRSEILSFVRFWNIGLELKVFYFRTWVTHMVKKKSEIPHHWFLHANNDLCTKSLPQRSLEHNFLHNLYNQVQVQVQSPCVFVEKNK